MLSTPLVLAVAGLHFGPVPVGPAPVAAWPVPSAFAKPMLGAPLPTAILARINQDLTSVADAVDADTDLSHVGADEEIPKGWTGSVFAGGTISTGNTEQNQASARADAELRRENDRISLLGFWNYSDQTDQATGESSIVERNWGAKAQYDYFFAEDVYGYTNAAVFADSPQDLDLRTTLGAGGGYQAFETEDTALGLEAGIAYVDENFVGTESDTRYAAGRAAYSYRNQLTETTRFEQDVEALVSLENSDDVIVRADSRINIQINADLLATLQWVVDYDNTPAAGAERTDSRVSVGVTWQF